MTQILVSEVSEDLINRLKVRAQSHGRTLEEEAREILRVAVHDAPTGQPGNLGSRIAARFSKIGLEEPIQELRGWQARPAEFD